MRSFRKNDFSQNSSLAKKCQEEISEGYLVEKRPVNKEVCERRILVKPGDVKGFSKGLQYLVEHPDLGKQMGQKGKRGEKEGTFV